MVKEILNALAVYIYSQHVIMSLQTKQKERYNKMNKRDPKTGRFVSSKKACKCTAKKVATKKTAVKKAVTKTAKKTTKKAAK